MTPARKYGLALVAVMAVGLALRWSHMGTYSLWYDEVLSLFYAEEPARFLPGGESGSDAPLYLALLYGWRTVAESEAGLRALSLLFGLATLPLLYRLGAELFGRRTGLIAAAMLAVGALQVYYAQELRSYTLTAFLATGAMLCFVRERVGGGRGALIGFGLLSVLAAYSHYLAGTVFISGLAYMLLYHRYDRAVRRRWLILTGGVALAVLPLAVAFFGQLAAPDAVHWTRAVQVRDVKMLLNHFAFGYQVNNGLIPEGTRQFSFTRNVGFLFALGLLGFGLWRAGKIEKPVASGRPVSPVGLLVLFGLMPVGLILLGSLGVRSAFMTRYLMFCSPVYFLAFAVGLAAIPRRPLRIAVAGFFLAMNGFSIYGIYTNSRLHDLEGVYTRRENREMAEFIRSQRRPNDAVVHTLESTLVPVRYYTRKEKGLPTYLLLFPSRVVSELPFPGLEHENPVYPLEDAERLAGYDRLWYVRGWWVKEGDPYDQATSPEAVAWLKKRYKKVEGVDKAFKGGQVTLYRKRPQE